MTVGRRHGMQREEVKAIRLLAKRLVIAGAVILITVVCAVIGLIIWVATRLI